jgi:hypothetical protein
VEKDNLTITIDRLLDLLKDKSMILTESNTSQQTLIDSLETLSSAGHRGLFRKIVSGGKERTARENAKRYVKEVQALDDINKVNYVIVQRLGYNFGTAWMISSNFSLQKELNK